ncbi:recombinase family protein [Peribacillus butanolivorans]|uniref:recombinase family protein n=1 Tax=Peribacillus butanolivorans TaxID=421767 RepID=UPI0030C96783
MFQNSSLSEHTAVQSERAFFIAFFVTKLCSQLYVHKPIEFYRTKKQRPGLAEALEYAREGDTIVVWRLDRLGRNMQDLIHIVNSLNERGVGFHSLQENLTMDKSNATGQLMFHLFAAFAEFERNLIEERSAAGRAAARARGRLGGRPEKFGPKDIEMMKSLIENGTPIKDVAEKWGVSRTTIYRYLEKQK